MTTLAEIVARMVINLIWAGWIVAALILGGQIQNTAPVTTDWCPWREHLQAYICPGGETLDERMARR